MAVDLNDSLDCSIDLSETQKTESACKTTAIQVLHWFTCIFFPQERRNPHPILKVNEYNTQEVNASSSRNSGRVDHNQYHTGGSVPSDDSGIRAHRTASRERKYGEHDPDCGKTILRKYDVFRYYEVGHIGV